jgi:hypothetical protein
MERKQLLNAITYHSIVMATIQLTDVEERIKRIIGWIIAEGNIRSFFSGRPTTAST